MRRTSTAGRPPAAGRIALLALVLLAGATTAHAAATTTTAPRTVHLPWTSPSLTTRDAVSAALNNTLSQYAGAPTDKTTGQINCTALVQALQATHANTYSYLLWDTTGDNYLALVRCLDATVGVTIDGTPLRAWVTLIPPTETESGRCSVPADSPLTPFNETSLFDTSMGTGGCNDYPGWSTCLGMLAAQYKHLVGVNIDDMVPGNIAGTPFNGHFSPSNLTTFGATLKAHGAPWLAFVPTSYYYKTHSFVFDMYPDLADWVDGLLFYFLNSKQGPSPDCAAATCPVPKRASCPGCLAGTCAEATAANVVDELSDFATRLVDKTTGQPKPLLLGFYASGHAACGLPSAHYVDLVLGHAVPLIGGRLTGINVYTMQQAPTDCSGPAGTQNKGCIVQRQFGGAPAAAALPLV